MPIAHWELAFRFHTTARNIRRMEAGENSITLQTLNQGATAMRAQVSMTIETSVMP